MKKLEEKVMNESQPETGKFNDLESDLRTDSK